MALFCDYVGSGFASGANLASRNLCVESIHILDMINSAQFVTICHFHANFGDFALFALSSDRNLLAGGFDRKQL